MSDDFVFDLEKAIEAQRDYLDKERLPKIRDLFRTFHANFMSLYNVLLKKGQIGEDPYKADTKISEVQAPDASPFLENEKNEKMSIRLSQFESQLDFLNNYYQFSAEFLSMKRLKGITELINYIQWAKLSENSTSTNTRATAEMVNKVRQGTDPLSANIINDAVNQLAKISSQLLTHFKELTAFQREFYKREVRERVLHKISVPDGSPGERHEAAVKKIKRAFAEEMSDEPYYPELIDEILQEEYAENSSQLKDELLKRLYPQIQEKKEEKKDDYKGLLLDAIRQLSAASLHLDKTIQKLNESLMLIKQKRVTISERFRNWLKSLVQKKDEANILPVEVFDERTAISKTVKVNYDQFIQNVSKTAKILSVLSSKVSSTYMRLENAEDDKVFEFLSGQIVELEKMLNLLPALDVYFKSEVPRESRGRMKGIKLEINAIKNILIKVKQKRHEYVAKKDEEEQLKKLGIKI
ncbi:MAG: hypothetical protein JXB03_09440 [Spirochaetales bacterium]|nr:hypothetical protein [Spirochaetales bacterium]